MPKRGYDMKHIEDAMAALKINPKSANNRLAVKRELNRFFPEATCNSVMYTENTDKLFFGMMVWPDLQDDQVTEIALGDKTTDALRVKYYTVDIDSKLFDSIQLDPKELTAILIHEVGHMVIDDSASKIVQRNMDEYFRKERTHLDADQLSYALDVVKFGISDAMVKAVSLWYRDEEVVADSFVVSAGYGPYLKSALTKIGSSSFTSLKQPNVPKYIMLYWSLRLYMDIFTKRVPAIKTLDTAIKISGSDLCKKRMDYLKKVLINYVAPAAAVRGDISNPVLSDDVISEGAKVIRQVYSEGGFFKGMKQQGLRSIENDYFELSMRSQNIEDEADAMGILRSINMRLTILGNYIAGANVDSSTKSQYQDLYNKFMQLRLDLSSKKVYRKANYGLYYNYNDLTNDQMKAYDPTF